MQTLRDAAKRQLNGAVVIAIKPASNKHEFIVATWRDPNALPSNSYSLHLAYPVKGGWMFCNGEYDISFADISDRFLNRNQ